MERVLPGESLPRAISLSNTGIFVISSSDPETVCDVRIRKPQTPAITRGKLRELMTLTRYPEQMREKVKKLLLKRSINSWTKMRDLRHTLIQYLQQQKCFGTGEDKTIEREEDVRR